MFVVNVSQDWLQGTTLDWCSDAFRMGLSSFLKGILKQHQQVRRGSYVIQNWVQHLILDLQISPFWLEFLNNGLTDVNSELQIAPFTM